MIEYKTIMQYLRDAQHPFLWEKKDEELNELANKENWRVVGISHMSEKQRFVMVIRETSDDTP
jgi:hypothetical protein